MNTKLKSLLQQLLQSPRHFPVEFALGVVFFIIAVWDSETSAWNEAAARMDGGCYDFQLFKKQTITAPWHYVCCEKKAPEINREP